jgi:predicted nucleotidyltransferase component of viral defense system
MFENTLSPETLEFVKKIKSEDLPVGSYLGGGTAIALRIGHRKSVDLDFFTPTQFNENQWQQKLENEMGFNLIQKDWQTLVGNVQDVKFSLFYYKHNLINETSDFYNIKLASLEDLSAMKLDTVISRGTKRDLIDIYFLAQKFSLPKMYEFYDKKFGSFKDREIMIKKSLVYFDDAEKDETPDMLTPLDWGSLKVFFKKEVEL